VCPRFEQDALGNVIDPPGKAKNIPVPVRQFNVAAVLANKVLPNELGVKIPSHADLDPQFRDPLTDEELTTFGQQSVGGSPNPDGGTLVYNRRGTVVPGDALHRGGAGPLNDPTGMMYVRLEDLTHQFLKGPDGLIGTADDVSPDANGDEIDDRCLDLNGKWHILDPECPVALKDDAPVEPLVLRAEAGDCIETTLYNKLIDQATATVNGATSPVFSNENGTIRAVFDQTDAEKLLLRDATFQTANGDVVTIDQIVYDHIPELAGWQDLFWVVNRHMFRGGDDPTTPEVEQTGDILPPEQRRCDPVTGVCQMHFFNNNLIAASPQAGLHPQLVEFDMSRDDAVAAGQNNSDGIARERSNVTYRWYAGHIEPVFVGFSGNKRNPRRDFRRVATPVEFGGVNLLSSDRVKQPQKGLYGALVIEPKGAVWPDALADLDDVSDGQGTGTDTRKTRAQVDVSAPVGGAGSGGDYRENISVTYRIANLRWADGTAIPNIHQGELGREGAEDSGHAGYNYGTEPSWFRFKLAPDVPFGNAGTPGSFGAIENMHAFFANGLTIGEPNAVPAIAGGVAAEGDPATPVYRAQAGQAARIHVLNGASADRDATFILHGHVWQRDPFVCPDDSYWTLEGLCNPGSVPSQALGINPLGKGMGGEEGMGHVFGHWPILFNAGGAFAVPGDYLYRDYAPSGGRNGMFGILRVGGGN
jgi:hypothetical protein